MLRDYLCKALQGKCTMSRAFVIDNYTKVLSVKNQMGNLVLNSGMLERDKFKFLDLMYLPYCFSIYV